MYLGGATVVVVFVVKNERGLSVCVGYSRDISKQFSLSLISLSAPEVLGPEHYDMSCDMWSIGVISYIL